MNLDDLLHVECWARDQHDFLNVAWQTVDKRKVCNLVMKSESVFKTYANKIIQKLDRKIVQLKSRSIVVSPTIRFRRHIVLSCVPVCLFDFQSQIMSTLVNVKK